MSREYIRSSLLLKAVCKMHLDQTVAYLRSLHAVIGPADLQRWYALLEGDLWKQTQAAAQAAQKQARETDAPEMELCIDARPGGCVVLVTVAPWCSEKRFIGSLPEYNYFHLIRAQRTAFRHTLDDWSQREFAHWIFLEGRDEQGTYDISISLLYLWSFREILREIGCYQKLHPNEPPRLERPMILPTSLMSTSPTDLVGQLMHDDAMLWEIDKHR